MNDNDESKNIIKKSSPPLPKKVGQKLTSQAKRVLGLLKSYIDQPPQPFVVQGQNPKVGDTITVTLPGGLEMAFCYIPAGEFMMGSSDQEVLEAFQDSKKTFGEEAKVEWFLGEKPKHRVVFTQPFWMGQFVVTQAQWESVMGSSPSYRGWGFPDPNNPAEMISWDDCQEFIQKLNAHNDGNFYALPTEAQWEYACRAGTTTPFSFGGTVTPDQVNYDGNKPYGNAAVGLNRQKTVPVGLLNSPNAWGLHDMHGNVDEWCADWYSENYYGRSPMNDPKGAESGKSRVVRGGSWFINANSCRSACRHYFQPGLRLKFVGVRVVVIPART